MAEWIQDLAARRTAFREKLEERQTLTIPSEDPDWEGPGQAFPAPAAREKNAILQPPKPQIRPSASFFELAHARDAAREGAD